MKKKLISILISSLVCFISLCFMVPINNIKADSNGTYIHGIANDLYLFATSSNGEYLKYVKTNVDTDWALVNYSGTVYWVGFSDNQFTLSVMHGYSEDSLSTMGTYTSGYSSVWQKQRLNNRSYIDSVGNTYNYTINNCNGVSVNGYNDVNACGFYYIYGDGAVDPAPPISPPEITYNYYTDFASNQQNIVNSLKSNRDTITWNYDPTNSNINGLDIRIELRAVPCKYYASTENALDNLSWGDISIESSYIADLGSYHWNQNGSKASFTWEEVIDKFTYYSNLPAWYNDTFNFWNFKKKYFSNYWYWCGWVYQARINTVSGDYTGEWETIYQVSSAPPDSASTVINYYVTGTGVTEPIYQTIQNINNQNNITNNQWYVNGSPFNVDDNTTSNWWEQLLQFIRDIVAEILGFLGGIFDSVINGVLELVNNLGINFLDVFTNLINNIVDLFGNIDLTGSGYTIPEEYTNNVNTFNTWTTGIFNVFITSGLGLFVFIPMIMLVVRLFL